MVNNYPWTQADQTAELDALTVDYFELIACRDELEDNLRRINEQIKQKKKRIDELNKRLP